MPQETTEIGATQADAPRRGRPPSLDKRASILEAASTLFLRDGFDRTSIEAVASVAHVSKPTVYSHYEGKEDLFRAVVEAARVQLPGPPMTANGVLLAPDDLEQSLIAVGRWFVGILLAPRIAALRRLVISEIARRPELETLWTAGEPDRFRTALARDIQYLSERGVLSVGNAPRAVDQLISLLAHPTYAKTLYGMHQLTSAQETEIVTSAASFFLDAYLVRDPLKPR
jgi:TetR/AcrR family transcriptional repressor of mexJK operon